MKILIVEDEIRLAEAVAFILTQEGYHVDICHDGKQGYTQALSRNYDAIILDFMLPGLDGSQIAQLLRQKHIHCPILMLSARSELHDKVLCLDGGADDYITKPFEKEELLARLRALVRRTERQQRNDVSFADLSLNISNRTLICQEESTHLSDKEFDVILTLLKNANQIVSKEFLIEHLWSDTSSADNSVETYISFLRKKLDILESRVKIITLRRLGYKLIDSSLEGVIPKV